MKYFVFLLLYLFSLSSFAGVLTEGICVRSPAMPAVVMKVHKVGDTSVSIQSNLSGNLLTQYSRNQLEEEIKIGTTEVVSCGLFKTPEAERADKDQPDSWDLFGYDLKANYTEFQQKYKSSIISCKDEKFYKLYGISNRREDHDPEAYVQIKNCNMKEEINIKFGQPTKGGPFVPLRLLKKVSEKKLFKPIVIEKLENKFNFKFKPAFGRINVKVADGFLNFYFHESPDYDENKKPIYAIFWEKSSTANLNDLIDKKLKDNADQIEKDKLDKSKKDNKDFNI